VTGRLGVRDERPALAAAALVSGGLVTFLLALVLLGGGADAADTGDEPLWTRTLPQPSSSGGIEAPAGVWTDGDTVVTADADGLRVLTANGEERWTLELEVQGWYGGWWGTPEGGAVVADDRVVTASNDRATVFDLATGEEVWRMPAPGAVQAVTADDQRVYLQVSDGRGNSTLRAHDLDTGTELWELAATGDRTAWSSGLAMTPYGLAVATVLPEFDEDTGEHVSDQTVVQLVDPATGSEVWRRDLPGGGHALADPAGGPIVLAVEGGVVGLDPATGDERWRWDGPAFPMGIADGAVVVVLRDDSDPTGQEPNVVLVVLDTSTGQERWRLDPAYEVVADVGGGRVAVASSQTPHGQPGTDGEALLAVHDLATGDVQAERRFSTATPWRPLGLALDDDTLHVTRTDGVVEALDPDTLEPRWSTGPGTDTTRDLTPVVTGTAVHLLGDDGAIRTVDLDDGTERWSALHGLEGGSPPTADSERVYAITGLGRIRGYDTRTGDTLWETDRRHGASTDTTPRPVVSGATVVAVDADGTLVALDTATGQERWTRPQPAPPIGLAATTSTVLVATTDGEVTALDPATGQPQWSAAVGSTLRSGPVVAGPVVAVITADGDITALDTTTGEPAWTHPTGTTRSSPLARDATTLYLRDEHGLVALDAATGDVRWETTADGTAYRGTPAVSRGQVFIAADDLTVRILSTETGQEADRIEVGTPILAIATAPDGSLIVLTTGPELRRYR
jgi:eukaryotic-like serine/threonine-protein kinase